MFKEVIELIDITEQPDEGGGFETVEKARNTVFANKKSARQSEFYMAAQAGLKAEVVFVVNNFDYQEERIVCHEGKYYTVIRTYETGENIELTCQKRIGLFDEVS